MAQHTITIGFTGTRKGMTDKQTLFIDNYLYKNLNNIKEVHHGDCIGADEQFHRMATKYNFRIIIHPPNKSILRAFCHSSDIMPEKDYIQRDNDIIESSDVLLACPRDTINTMGSGTWYCIRRALVAKKKVIIFYPNGAIVWYNTQKI